MKKTPKKLQLSKETLVTLNTGGLAKVVGGATSTIAITECNTDCECPDIK
jgi:hypothetical protein